MDKIHTVKHGHIIVFENKLGEWRYFDNDEPTSYYDKPRTCLFCSKEPLWCEICLDWHDGCLGHIEGVKNACCGHGYKGFGYIEREGEIDLDF